MTNFYENESKLYADAINHPIKHVRAAKINKNSQAYKKLMAAIENVPPEDRDLNALALLLAGDVYYLSPNDIEFHLKHETPIGVMLVRDAEQMERLMHQRNK